MTEDLDQEIIEHKFIIPIKDLEGTVLHPDYDWSTHKHRCDCGSDDEED